MNMKKKFVRLFSEVVEGHAPEMVNNKKHTAMLPYDMTFGNSLEDGWFGGRFYDILLPEDHPVYKDGKYVSFDDAYFNGMNFGDDIEGEIEEVFEFVERIPESQKERAAMEAVESEYDNGVGEFFNNLIDPKIVHVDYKDEGYPGPFVKVELSDEDYQTLVEFCDKHGFDEWLYKINKNVPFDQYYIYWDNLDEDSDISYPCKNDLRLAFMYDYFNKR